MAFDDWVIWAHRCNPMLTNESALYCVFQDNSIVDELQGQLPCMPLPVEANGANWVGSSEGASVLPGEVTPPAIACNVYGSWCPSDPNATNTLWLSWDVPAEGGAYRISTCNDSTSFDTQIALWSAEDCADWGSYTLVNASDDHGCEFAAYRSTMLTPCFQGGESLLIQIDGWGGQTGSGPAPGSGIPAC